jgi:ferredoxin
MQDVEVNFTVSGKKILIAGGTPLSVVCAKAGVPVKYNCKKGTCATCTITVDGTCEYNTYAYSASVFQCTCVHYLR